MYYCLSNLRLQQHLQFKKEVSRVYHLYLYCYHSIIVCKMYIRKNCPDCIQAPLPAMYSVCTCDVILMTKHMLVNLVELEKCTYFFPQLLD